MDSVISQRELRNDSGAVMRRVDQGESFTVTRNGTPVADLVPHDAGPGGPTRFVPITVIASGAAALEPWGIEEFTRDRRELDRAVDDRDIDPWAGR